jgi:hypothetical protein
MNANQRHPTPVKVRDRTYSFQLPVFSELFMDDSQETFHFSPTMKIEVEEPPKPIHESELPNVLSIIRAQSSPLPIRPHPKSTSESPPTYGSPNNEKKGAKGWGLFGKKNIDSPRKDDSPRNREFESLSHKEIEELFYAGIVR